MANPFTGIIQRGLEGARNTIDPTRPERMRNDAASTAVLDVLEQQVKSTPALAQNPRIQTLLELRRTNPEQAARVLQNPGLLAEIQQPAAPKPQSREGKLVADLTGLTPGTREFQSALKANLDQGTAGEAIFGGTGLEAQMFNQMLARVPEDQREAAILDASVAYLGRSRTGVDPITGQPTTSQVDLSGVTNRIPGAPPLPGAAQPRQPAGAPPSVPGASAPEAAPAAPASSLLESVLPSGTTLFEQAGNLTGPDSFIARNVPKTPGLGGLTNETTSAAQFAEDTTEILIDALRTDRTESSRAIAEVESLRERFGFKPETFSNPEQVQRKTATAWLLLNERRKEILERQSNPGTTSLEAKKNDMAALSRITQVMPRISPPVLQEQTEVDAFFADPANKGAKVVLPDGKGNFKRYVVQ